MLIAAVLKDIGPKECMHLGKAIASHLKITGKASFLHYINLAGNRVCGFDFTKPHPPKSAASESEANQEEHTNTIRF